MNNAGRGLGTCGPPHTFMIALVEPRDRLRCGCGGVNMERRLPRLIALIALLSCGGCYVWVDREPASLDRSRLRAQAKVAKIESRPEEKRGKPHSLKLWVYDRSEDQLVKASVPLWIVRKIAAHVEEPDRGQDPDLARLGLTIEKVCSSPPGLLVRIDSEEEEVLAWLE